MAAPVLTLGEWLAELRGNGPLPPLLIQDNQNPDSQSYPPTERILVLACHEFIFDSWIREYALPDSFRIAGGFRIKHRIFLPVICSDPHMLYGWDRPTLIASACIDRKQHAEVHDYAAAKYQIWED